MSDATLTNKLARADEHLAALDAQAREARSREPCSVVTERQSDGTYIARVQISEAPPLRLGLILGDVLYNWRSALNNMIQLLIRLNGQTPGGNSSFHDEHDFESRGAKRTRGVSEEHAAIIASLQLFPGRTNPTIMALDLVNEHCNADKHAAIHPAVVAVRNPEQTTRSFRREPVATEFMFEFNPVGFEKPLKNGIEIARITPVGKPPETTPQLEAELTFELAFGERGLANEGAPGRPVSYSRYRRAVPGVRHVQGKLKARASDLRRRLRWCCSSSAHSGSIGSPRQPVHVSRIERGVPRDFLTTLPCGF